MHSKLLFMFALSVLIIGFCASADTKVPKRRNNSKRLKDISVKRQQDELVETITENPNKVQNTDAELNSGDKQSQEQETREPNADPNGRDEGNKRGKGKVDRCKNIRRQRYGQRVGNRNGYRSGIRDADRNGSNDGNRNDNRNGKRPNKNHKANRNRRNKLPRAARRQLIKA